MSRDAIAEVLGRLDYGDHKDEVDWRDRLTEVDGLLAAGVVVDVDELVISGAQDLWHDLRHTLLPLGWRVVLGWYDSLVIGWAPPGTTQQHLDSGYAPHVTAEAYGNGTTHVVWHPALPDDESRVADLQFHRSADALLAWLATP